MVTDEKSVCNLNFSSEILKTLILSPPISHSIHTPLRPHPSNSSPCNPPPAATAVSAATAATQPPHQPSQLPATPQPRSPAAAQPPQPLHRHSLHHHRRRSVAVVESCVAVIGSSLAVVWKLVGLLLCSSTLLLSLCRRCVSATALPPRFHSRVMTVPSLLHWK
ncbi:hypothetical protein HN51_067379 [Arachis hypogaea]